MAKVGRPKKTFDIEQVKLLGQFRATFQTMADWFQCSYKTIERQMQDEESEFCHTYKKSFAGTKLKLSEAQIQYALKGNASLLIWLGKQYLDQTEKAENSSDVVDLKEFAEALKGGVIE